MRQFIQRKVYYQGAIVNILAFNEDDFNTQLKVVMRKIEDNFLKERLNEFKNSLRYYIAKKFNYDMNWTRTPDFSHYENIETLRGYILFVQKPIIEEL